MFPRTRAILRHRFVKRFIAPAGPALAALWAAGVGRVSATPLVVRSGIAVVQGAGRALVLSAGFLGGNTGSRASGVSFAEAKPNPQVKASAALVGSSEVQCIVTSRLQSQSRAFGSSEARSNSEQRSVMVDNTGDPFTDESGDTFQLIS